MILLEKRCNIMKILYTYKYVNYFLVIIGFSFLVIIGFSKPLGRSSVRTL